MIIELEAILVEVLRVRNRILHAKGLPLSDTAFIKSRAENLYKDLYGKHNDDIKEFKCSNGWVSRFKERHRHVYDPEHQTRNLNQNHGGGLVTDGSNSTRSSSHAPPTTTIHHSAAANQGVGGEHVTPPSNYLFI